MTIPASVIAQMATLGLSAQQGAAVAAMLSAVESATREMLVAERDEALEHRRRSDADRQARKRERDLMSRDITLRHDDRILASAGDVRGEDKPLPQKIEPQESKKDALRDVDAFKAELSPHLSADQVGAFVKLRRQKRAVISGHSARLFLAAVARCGISVSEAADKCISRNWISIEPEWLTPAARGSPVQPKPNSIQAAIERRRASQNGNDDRPAGLGGAAVLQLPNLSERGR